MWTRGSLKKLSFQTEHNQIITLPSQKESAQRDPKSPREMFCSLEFGCRTLFTIDVRKQPAHPEVLSFVKRAGIRPMRMKATTIREEDSIRRCAAISSLGSFSSIRHVRLVIARLVILLIQKYPK